MLKKICQKFFASDDGAASMDQEDDKSPNF
jgi:hypothetical protein